MPQKVGSLSRSMPLSKLSVRTVRCGRAVTQLSVVSQEPQQPQTLARVLRRRLATADVSNTCTTAVESEVPNDRRNMEYRMHWNDDGTVTVTTVKAGEVIKTETMTQDQYNEWNKQFS